MRRSHIYLAAIAIATLCVVMAAPGAAQEEKSPSPTGVSPIEGMASGTPPRSSLSAEQQAEYDDLAPDQKFTHDSWPAETRSYYWSLTPEKQDMFWRLSDEDKIALTAMTGPERTAAWKIIEGKAKAGDDGGR